MKRVMNSSNAHSDGYLASKVIHDMRQLRNSIDTLQEANKELYNKMDLDAFYSELEFALMEAVNAIEY